jgi:GNAT superfamily N-acetyltransferase
VAVRLVQGSRDLRAFIDLPYRLHAGDPVWVPPLRAEVRQRLGRRNPFFDHGEADYFLVERDGRIVGRIAVAANRLHDEIHGDGVAFFGFFECENDQAAADALFDRAAAWARERGYRVLRGPASFSVNEEYGLLVDGFDTPPTLMMTHNPPFYVDLVEGGGFTKAKDLWAFAGGDAKAPVPVPERLARAIERLGRGSGVRLRGLDRTRFNDEVARVMQAYNTAWECNWGFLPMTPREIEHAARQFRPIYIADLVAFAEKDGEVVGFALAVPDVNEILRTNRSGRLLPVAPRLLWSLWRERLRRVRILLLGVLPEYRGKGVDAMLWHWIWTRAARHGIGWGEAGWILEDNPAMVNAATRMGFTRYETYRIYERAL